jgi:hypothetical protein
MAFAPTRGVFLDYERNPSVSIGEQDHIRIVDFDELQKIGQDYPLQPLELSLVAVRDLDTGDLPGNVGSPITSIPMTLKGTSKSGENLDSYLSPQGKRSFSARYR